MSGSDGLLVAKADREIRLLPRMANRHGLIAGATGTGKTVSLQTLAHAFSDLGVPVFLADVKGDLSGLARPGSLANKKVAERIDLLELKDFVFESCPVTFWDVFAEQGLPLRATPTEIGPLLLSRILKLNDTQTGLMSLAFKVSDDEELLLLDLKDLRALIQFVGENAKDLRNQYGQVSPSSIGAIQRSLLHLEQQGAEQFLGEPALTLDDLMRVDGEGRGMINILAADKLLNAPHLYCSFLLWLLSELFETMPEVGDLEKPKLVFFFDEAHLLFDNAPKELVDKVEQVVRLIRSKGVGVYFCTQNPMDVPDTILGQLGNRIQHALRAFTPRDRKAVKAAADTFRTNPNLDTEEAITQLGIGEALISVLDAKGMPTPVERAYVVPPRSQIGPISEEERAGHVQLSPLFAKYRDGLDRESAYEKLRNRAEVAAEEAQTDAARKARLDQIFEEDRKRRQSKPSRSRGGGSRSSRETPGEAFAKSTARSFGTNFGRVLSRGIFEVFGIGGSKGRKR